MPENRWEPKDAAHFEGDLVAMRAYTSRLLGGDADLVLHGGGNTSVKVNSPDLHGDQQEVLWVKGSGWDLASMQPAGFTPLQLGPVRRLAELDTLSDDQMMRALRSASVNPDAPAPSVETITHALIPFRFVDHTHADGVVTLSNTPNGVQMLQEIYDDSVLLIPYAMPGFILAKLIAELTQDVDWGNLKALVLMNHGIFTFADDARESYDLMIQMVAMAEARLPEIPPPASHEIELWGDDLETLVRLRKRASDVAGRPVVAVADHSPRLVAFSERVDAADLASRGCLTPDHVIHTKPSPAVLEGGPEETVDRFAGAYDKYFARYASRGVTQLDSSPRWLIWPGKGIVSFGVSSARARVVRDIAAHTSRAAQQAEELGGWLPLAPEQLFDVEYWELEQAKLSRVGTPASLQGKIAIVTGAASGIGKACVDRLLLQGVAVVALDINPNVAELSTDPAYVGLRCDITDTSVVTEAVKVAVQRFGGIDLVISNAGVFPLSQTLEGMDDQAWEASLDVNLTGHLRVVRAAIPYLKYGIDPAVVIVGSKNVPAPGPGAGAYSAAKAGLTQMARVGALELGKYGIRVNTLHPNAVFDTGVWTDDVMQSRADAYGLSVDEYKRNNVLGVEITAADVASLAIAMASPLFAKTTGAQIPIDGGNERVI